MLPQRVSLPSAWRPRAAVIALALLLSACATLPQRGQIVMRDVAFPLRDFRFPSGLRVVVEQDARSPVVAVVAVVGAGGSSDPGGKEGLAHVVEHLAFRSRHAGGPSVWRRLEASGAGSYNASTSLDYTSYETLGPKEALPTLLKMEGQRLSAPLAGVSPEVFAVEREVVRNELRQRNETGYVGQVFSWMNAAAFPGGHAYARPLAGTHESLSALSLSDAQRFARAHYRPDNVTLVIAGDVDLAAVEATLRANLPEAWVGTGAPLALEARLPAQPAAPATTPAQKSVPVFTASVPTPEVYLSWVLPRGFDEASAVQDFVRASFSQNLWGAVRNDADIADISTNLIPGTRASLLVVRVRLSRGDDPARSAGKVLDQVQNAWVQEIQPGSVLGREFDFQAMRRKVVTGMVLESEDLMSRTERRALLTHFTQDVRSYTRSQVALMGLVGGKVTDFSYQWLQRDRVRMIVVRPGEVPGAATVAATLSADEEPWASPAEQVTPSMTAALDSPVQVLKLDNGMEVLLAPRPGLPVVRIGAALRGGSSYGEKPGVADLANWGAFRESWFEGRPSDWGLHSTSSFQRDHLRVGISGTAGNVGNMLAMLAEQLDSTRTSEDVVRYYREQVLPWRRAVDSNPELLAERHLQKALYGTHPYAREVTGEELAQVSWTEAEAWLKDVYRPANTVVVIAGEFDVKEVEGLARKYLGGWSRGKAKPVATPPAPALPAASANAKALLTPRPGASQAQVQLACRLPTATPEAEARYALMAELIHGHASGEMRSRRGATYGFFARPWLGRGGAAHLVLEGAVDAQRMGEGLSTVRQILASFAKEVPEPSLERARRGMLAAQAVSFISSEAWVNALLTARVRGFEPDTVTGRPALLQAVTAESLRKEFEGCYQRLVVSITADEGQARSAIQAMSQP
ncbi:insulinase family protein [Myxococcus sp. AM009]|uniref:M16 family metallopeptidase n=1 Tax=unclassified Myxococcus TaxID=2648731 RepID=UPI001595E96F|nr:MULTISPECIES: pitrilysin family protein [unclassified Myxococcus]NVJ00172.1 insulinase family protein [Myxococcus sp. AM009]NVJ18621.1 insulinase family protein [Myxococcus sp. AM010]